MQTLEGTILQIFRGCPFANLQGCVTSRKLTSMLQVLFGIAASHTGGMGKTLPLDSKTRDNARLNAGHHESELASAAAGAHVSAAQLVCGHT